METSGNINNRYGTNGKTVTLDFDNCMTKQINEIILSIIKRDTSRGIGYDKVKKRVVIYPKGVDLVHTGDLMNTAQASVKGITWIVPYAREVNAKYPYAGISAKQKEEIAAIIKPLIAKNILKQGSR